MKDGHTYHWCKGDHWHDGNVVNGMYCFHKTEEHDNWRKELDAAKELKATMRGGNSNAGTTGNSTGAQAIPKPNDTSKKLALSEKLRAAYHAHRSLC